MFQTQFNSTIKTLPTDHGGEYTSHDFTTYLLSHGITHQFSCPYTSEQNGIAECKNHHILETTRTTLLHHASLPFHFWFETASTAAYLINRLPTKTLQMHPPYQKLYNKSPSFLHLKTFGCLCYPWTAYARNHKLDPKSSHFIFLGYSTDNKGFRCFDSATSKLLISRHVRFHEHEFPMATPPTTTHSRHISTTHNPIPLPLLPTFYPPPTHPPLTNRATPPTPPSPPPRKIDTHIQYQRRRIHPTTLPISTPPLLPLPAPSTPTPTTNPPHQNPIPPNQPHTIH